MSVNSEINRIKANVSNAYTEIVNKGGTAPTARTSENLASTINTIPTSFIIHYTDDKYTAMNNKTFDFQYSG